MIQIIFVILVILHALENALIRKHRLKKKDYRDIHHPSQAIIYLSASIIISIFGNIYFGFPYWELGLLALLTRMVFFDISFNIFTGRRLDYENPKGTSMIDKIEQALPFIHRQFIYTGLWIILILATMQKG
jgi:hypothetical protein